MRYKIINYIIIYNFPPTRIVPVFMSTTLTVNYVNYVNDTCEIFLCLTFYYLQITP